jgi:hypothetical protein
MSLRRLEGDEAANLIVQVLREATAVFLNRLRNRDVIKGERSKERRGWIWWVEG